MSQAQFFYEGMAGAPAGSASLQGSLVAILDACLVNGFNSQVATSLTSVGTTATCTKVAHGFKDRQMVNVSGATPGGYNGNQRIVRIDADHFTYTLGGALASPATGVITVKTSSLGWTIDFTAANQRAYRPAAGNRFFLSVDDSAADSVFTPHVRGYETMSAILTGTNPFPTDAILRVSDPGGPQMRWLRPQYAQALPTQFGWYLVGDAKRFYMGIPGYSSGKMRFLSGFGDYTSYAGVDAFNTFIGGDPSHGNGDAYYYYADWPNVTQPPSPSNASFFQTVMCSARGYDQSTPARCCSVAAGGGNWASYPPFLGASMFNSAPAYGTSSPITGGIELSRVDIWEQDIANSSWFWRRGRFPGQLAALSPPDYLNNDGVVYPAVPEFGDIIIFEGGNTGSTFGSIFALNDWDL